MLITPQNLPISLREEIVLEIILARDRVRKTRENSLMHAQLLEVCNNYIHKNSHKNQCENGFFPLASKRLGIFLRRSSTPISTTVYQPFFCLILQGEKWFYHEDQRLKFDTGESLIIGQDTPITGQIGEASDERPYIAIVISLEVEGLRRVYDRFSAAFWAEWDGAGARAASPLSIAAVSPALSDAILRYIRSDCEDAERGVLEPLYYEEILFRVLTARNGALLRRQLSQSDEEMRILRVVERLKADFRRPLPVGELARSAGMSVSSFHKAFKNFTGITPLQYQKDLRMSEAQTLLSKGSMSISQIAYEIGYQSPSQFSREYTHRFREPPRLYLGRALETG